ncbi:MAG: penicillin-binding transpeptidase domain-containing protein, partial [Defluviitaleaceae bacterium]|nr:penicillin-binding transpeptidase domain-containing protein [Defluviitaleaceae bacterium]
VIDGYTIGGKTGTGEQGVPRGDWVVTSFLGYMPVENPQFLAMAVVYNPADNQLTAGASAAPMLREVFEGIIQYRQLPPAGAEQTTGILLDVGREILPDFSGMELQEVAIILNNMGIDYMITGRGAIVSHHIPTAGQPTPRDTPIFLHLDGNIDNLYELTFVPNVEGLPESRAVEQIIAAGLVPVVVTRANMGRGDWLLSFDANEAEYEEIDEPADNWIIYRQFPSSGLHIQRGTQIRLRAREAE